ncbi:MAG: hypothetical protein ABIU54_07750 [Candidatus Eisenbacteria bacterium]
MSARIHPLAFVVLFCTILFPTGVAMSASALPDTGVFAPVARHYRSRLEQVRAGTGNATPERIGLLLAIGQPEQAVRQAGSLRGDPREAAVARARALLAVQDFAAAAPLLARIQAEASASDAERAVGLAWASVRDDAGAIDSLTRAAVAGHEDARAIPELLAAGRQAYAMLDYPRAEALFQRALAVIPKSAEAGSAAASRRDAALVGLGFVQQKHRDWDGSFATLRQALEVDGSAEALMAITESLIRLGRTDDAISACEWAVRLAPDYDAAHYSLGNGYARKNYTQLAQAFPRAFADAAGRAAIKRADARLAAGDRVGARAAHASLVKAHPGWADARVRLASLDFEDGRFAAARAGCVAALQACPEYGRAHAVLAKALEAQRFAVDVHRAEYEARFAAATMPKVPGIEKFVANWRSLSPRHQKRVALSVAPWKTYLPVLIDGGATYYIKPVHMLLSECPNLETLRDQRISYDSRLWDDVRGCGGYHTVTGIEDVERTIFDRYNTVLHELTHQVHSVLPADDSRTIQEHYRRAKERDDKMHDAFLSRYAGGSVYEYFAEGANALDSPMRDRYDSREVVRERLDRMDPELRSLVVQLAGRTDLSGSYPVAYSAGGDDRVGRGQVSDGIPFYRKALALEPTNETALVSLTNALLLGNRPAEAESVIAGARKVHPASGPVQTTAAQAAVHAGRPIAGARAALLSARSAVRAEDRYQVDLSLGRLAWIAGDATAAIAAFDSVLAYQSDNPEGRHGRAAALALASRFEESFALYEKVVRERTGVVELRCDFARDLLRAGRVDAARAQLAEAKLLDEENPTAEALRAWADLSAGAIEPARAHARQAMVWGPWGDLAQAVSGAIERRAGRPDSAKAAWKGLEGRITANAPPAYVYRSRLAVWEEIHLMPAVERAMLRQWQQ